MFGAARIFCCTGAPTFRFMRKMATNTGPVFELRIYNLKPECFQAFMGLLAKYWSVRSAHSKSIGFWSSELGGIAEVVHIWEYESLSRRAADRKKLATDETWQKEFLLKFFPQVNLMTNSLMVLAHGTSLNTDFKPSDSAVYELHTREAMVKSPSRDQNETLVGHFNGVYGPTGTEYLLYRYTDPDAAIAGAMRRREDVNVKGYSRLMIPSAWSPLK